MIQVTDNNWDGIQVPKSDLDNLMRIANCKISSLKNLLILPPNIKSTEDKIGDQHIIDIDYNTKRLTTGNIMGFVGCGGTQVSIRSRFANSEREDYFLHYMLQRVFNINLFDLKHSKSDEPVFDFLMYLFPYFLKKAWTQGMFKKYVSNKYNDSNVRGVIDIPRHISHNIPFNGRIAYNTREYSFDNPVTQLVRHTIEYIRTKDSSDYVLSADEDTRSAVSDIVMSTPTYSRNLRNAVVNANLRPLSHPYFTQWKPLQSICLQILRHDSIKYGNDPDDIYGILFDGAWLWEEYINKVLDGKGFTHPQNKLGKNPIYVFQNHDTPRYPDFIKEDFILDAKYKRLDNGIGRDDLNQIVTYLYITQYKRGGFIFPSETKTGLEYVGNLEGYGGDLVKYSLRIPKADSYSDFSDRIGVEEELLRRAL